MKFVFTPFNLALGLVAGLIGQKIFEKGAIFRLVKGLIDHGARRAFSGATGSRLATRPPNPSRRRPAARTNVQGPSVKQAVRSGAGIDPY